MDNREGNSVHPFVGYLLDHLGPSPKRRDSGMVARMKRSDNPDTDWQAWETLVRFGVDIEHASRRLPYCTVGAALCRENRGADGSLGLGAALRLCFNDDDGDQGVLRLRRLLACRTAEELCRVLRGVLSLIGSKAGGRLCYSRLLDDLNRFDTSRQDAVKARWVAEYWRTERSEDGEDA